MNWPVGCIVEIVASSSQLLEWYWELQVKAQRRNTRLFSSISKCFLPFTNPSFLVRHQSVLHRMIVTREPGFCSDSELTQRQVAQLKRSDTKPTILGYREIVLTRVDGVKLDLCFVPQLTYPPPVPLYSLWSSDYSNISYPQSSSMNSSNAATLYVCRSHRVKLARSYLPTYSDSSVRIVVKISGKIIILNRLLSWSSPLVNAALKGDHFPETKRRYYVTATVNGERKRTAAAAASDVPSWNETFFLWVPVIKPLVRLNPE